MFWVLIALLAGLWLGRRTVRAGPALWHAKNELTIARARADQLEYALAISRDTYVNHLQHCPLTHTDHGDAA